MRERVGAFRKYDKNERLVLVEGHANSF